VFGECHFVTSLTFSGIVLEVYLLVDFRKLHKCVCFPESQLVGKTITWLLSCLGGQEELFSLVACELMTVLVSM